MRREFITHDVTYTDSETWDLGFGYIRSSYGITDRLRMSLDVAGYHQRSGPGDMISFAGAFGGSLQGALLSFGSGRTLEATGLYWEAHRSQVYSDGSEVEMGIARSISFVVRQRNAIFVNGYAGAHYIHYRYENLSPGRFMNRKRYSNSSWFSHRDFGVIGGAETKLFHHVTLDVEGTYTGDWGLTGEVGWEF